MPYSLVSLEQPLNDFTSSVQLFPVGCKGWIAGISSLARTTAGLRSFYTTEKSSFARHGKMIVFLFGASIFSLGVFACIPGESSFLVPWIFHGDAELVFLRGPGQFQGTQMTSSPNRCDVTFPV